uniref:Uncharacterized protein n=1 Tax=Glossina pallidipes TaxID=7398 RepID=A0A1B0AHQ0_GLOPL
MILLEYLLQNEQQQIVLNLSAPLQAITLNKRTFNIIIITTTIITITTCSTTTTTSTITSTLPSLMVSLILPANSNERQNVAATTTHHDFIVLEDLPQLDASLANQDSPTAHDQLLASMVDEFLKDPCDTERPTQDLEEELNKATSLHIEYLEEPSSQVDGLIDFHHDHHHHHHHHHHDIRDSGSVESSSTNSSSLLTLSSANSLTTHLVDLPSNVKEISYQRFGRLNRNLSAENKK